MPITLFAHLGQHGLYNINRSVKVGVESLFYFTFGSFFNGASNSNTRIIDYYVNFFSFAIWLARTAELSTLSTSIGASFFGAYLLTPITD